MTGVWSRGKSKRAVTAAIKVFGSAMQVLLSITEEHSDQNQVCFVKIGGSYFVSVQRGF